MVENILAVFNTADEALTAAGRLKRAGFADKAITLMSSEPIHFEAEEAEEAEQTSRIGRFAIAGAMIGATSAVLLTVMTSRQVGLNTGGMPIVAPWAFGIIVFELTALGAILATLGRMVFEARLLRRGALEHYDPAVADGKIAVTVECAGAVQLEVAERVLAGKKMKML